MIKRLHDLRMATARTVIEGPGTTPQPLRQAVARGEPPEELRVLVDKIRNHAYRVTDEDIDALRGRYDEDALFEIIVATALGAAESRMAAALRALEEADAPVERRAG